MINQLSDGDKFLSLHESFIVVPMVGAISKVGGQNTFLKNDFAFGLKNSFLNMIHSFSLTLDGKVKCSTTEFSNIPLVFKQMTESSLSEMNDNPVGFFKDTSDSWHYLNHAPVELVDDQTEVDPFWMGHFRNGNGIINNVNIPDVDKNKTNAGCRINCGSAYNAGLYKRQTQLFTTASLDGALARDVFPSNGH
jgi:hypothetical protein